MEINELAKEVHENAVNHGFWEEKKSFGDIIALCHTELSEAFEEHRNGKPNVYCIYNANGDCRETNATCIRCMMEQPTTKPEGIAIELADCIIRILDYCGHEGIDIEEVIRIKHEYNKTRPYKHGGKKL